MLQKFTTYYQKHYLFSQSDKILLAVSGGKDSMAMLHFFKASNLNFDVAHCNFNLRGRESDADEQLVKTVCKKHQIPFFATHFNTTAYAEQNGISIQMAARDLRYNWFEELSAKNGYNFIATAHHKNDVAETMLINLSKGTGLAGLHGISKKSGKIIRPLLGFTREEIEVFVQENNVEFRDDQSNFNNKYTRNGIRLDVIPLLEKINPNVIESLNQTANYLSDVELILAEKIEEEFKQCTDQEEGRVLFDIEKLQSLTALPTQLYYFVKSYGFNATHVEDIIQSFNEQSGKQYFSKTHQIIKDRNYLILQKIKGNLNEEIIINTLEELELKTDWKVEQLKNSTQFEIQKSAKYANLDFDKIKLPLVLRNWSAGDVFQPLGMKGKKKLSDFFIDNKIDVLTKKTIQVLTSNNQIVWVVGYRIDDTFKLTENTKNLLIIKC
ncbi:MAG: tRNA lysidine(34) synthetase TilS [Flavobacteriales bacterium]|nr:tRNA lysidine(34) synthetase TilS [Flavobacteriales bacterium]MCB9362939.1 tRNA lysidine(34) synthetase TilS [Flavobacteriales bacterium]